MSSDPGPSEPFRWSERPLPTKPASPKDKPRKGRVDSPNPVPWKPRGENYSELQDGDFDLFRPLRPHPPRMSDYSRGPDENGHFTPPPLRKLHWKPSYSRFQGEAPSTPPPSTNHPKPVDVDDAKSMDRNSHRFLPLTPTPPQKSASVLPQMSPNYNPNRCECGFCASLPGILYPRFDNLGCPFLIPHHQCPDSSKNLELHPQCTTPRGPGAEHMPCPVCRLIMQRQEARRAVKGKKKEVTPDLPEKKKQYQGFLKLPAEIRLLFYSYLVPTSDPWEFYESRFTWHEEVRVPLRHDKGKCAPALLSTCKKIRDELMPEFYSHEQFTVQTHLKSIIWFDIEIKDIAKWPKAFSYITDLRLIVPLRYNPDEEEEEDARHIFSAVIAPRIVETIKRLDSSMPLRTRHITFEFTQQFASTVGYAPSEEFFATCFNLLIALHPVSSKKRITIGASPFVGDCWVDSVPSRRPWVLEQAFVGFNLAVLQMFHKRKMLSEERFLGLTRHVGRWHWVGYEEAWRRREEVPSSVGEAEIWLTTGGRKEVRL